MRFAVKFVGGLAVALLSFWTTLQLLDRSVQPTIVRVDSRCREGKVIALFDPFEKEKGHAYGKKLPEFSHLSDNATSGQSPLILCENGIVLGPAHSQHEDIRNLGGGRYSHWGDYLLFSTSDNSDPNRNDRGYSIAIVASR